MKQKTMKNYFQKFSHFNSQNLPQMFSETDYRERERDKKYTFCKITMATFFMLFRIFE